MRTLGHLHIQQLVAGRCLRISIQKEGGERFSKLSSVRQTRAELRAESSSA